MNSKNAKLYECCWHSYFLKLQNTFMHNFVKGKLWLILPTDTIFRKKQKLLSPLHSQHKIMLYLKWGKKKEGNGVYLVSKNLTKRRVLTKHSWQ